MGQLAKALNERPQGALPCNTIPNPRKDIKVITTQSGITLVGPSVSLPDSSSSSKEVERDPEPTMDQVHISSSESTARVSSLVVQPALVSKSKEIPERNPHQPPIPYPSSLIEALALMPKYAKILKDLLTNKEKLLEMANTPLNENCSALEACMALADLGASINLMPLSVWKKLMLLELLPTCMTLELAKRSVAYPAGRPFLRTTHALVDVYGEELILKVDDEKLTFKVDSTSKYSHKHGKESINMIDIFDINKGLALRLVYHPTSFIKVAFDLLRDALSAIFGLSELKEINNYDNESSDDDNNDDDVEKDEEDREEEEHLASADPSAVPTNDPHTPRSPSAKAGITEFAATLPSSSPPPENIKSDCPERKNRNHENQTRGAGARGAVHALREGETDQDPNNIKDEIKA
ncbi:hypothetical protein Tco_1078751 [Tanacetum coccineum]|uniref:Reverse transcriptase domain-containing protein n=1 Tax=Tanacetum coccineum TaxID=301880 RepID=A0ABQ5HR19_9ASTR